LTCYFKYKLKFNTLHTVCLSRNSTEQHIGDSETRRLEVKALLMASTNPTVEQAHYSNKDDNSDEDEEEEEEEE
jgi:hypothetical protein